MAYKLINYCEIDNFASQSYSRIHNVSQDLNLGDITLVDTSKLEDFDMLVGGSPCFVAGTKVLTKDGYKNIENIKVGEEVLTHKNRYRKVLKIGNTQNKEIWHLVAEDTSEFFATSNHPFLCVHLTKDGVSEIEEKALIDLTDKDLLISNYKLDGFGNIEYIYYNIILKEKTNRIETVYNIEVEEDHTYVVEDKFVHNCQDFSSSGKKAGAMWTCKNCKYEYNPLTAHFTKRDECPHCKSKNIEKTRSSLIVEYLRILRDKKPKFCVYENVKNLVGKEFKPTFDLFVKELKEYGYNVYYEVLNAKFYGIPQNRERIILVAIRKDLDNGKFKYPEPFDNGIRLKDILATNIDEHFYLPKQKTEKLLSNLSPDIKVKLFKSMENINNIGMLDFDNETNINKCIQNCKECPLYNIKSDNEINQINIVDSVKIRKYDINVSALKELLSMKKKESKLSNNEIANKLNIPKTTVDHWFRKDSSFAIPDANIWMNLKSLLKIENDSFDKSIMEFIEKPNEYDKTNRMYCVDGIAPTLTTVTANEKVIYPCAMIACEPRTDGMVLFNDNVCGTLRTIQACGDKHIIEGRSNMELPICCASRGRNPENPNSRITGLPTQQRIEINENGTSNTLTTVQKDNYVLEPCVLRYERNQYGKEIRKAYESGEVFEKRSAMRDLTPRKDGISNTLTTVQKDNYVFEPNWFAIRKLIPLECFRLMGFSDSDFSKAKYYTKTEEKEIKASGKKYKTEIDEQGIEHIVALSDSQAYKQAGNSIVTNVLYEVYKELFKAMPYLFDNLRLVSLFSGIGAFEKALDMLDDWKQNENFTKEEMT